MAEKPTPDFNLPSKLNRSRKFRRSAAGDRLSAESRKPIADSRQPTAESRLPKADFVNGLSMPCFFLETCKGSASGNFLI
jgi:hypothetical protein